ncbi:hypothetical protein [Vitreimonas sp.]|uniref:hypothetical protein n=1 Tax=Vitreimonas sp. TaxID=3069702 RepID=UPI002EDBACC7
MDDALTLPLADIWSRTRTMFARLRSLIGAKQWLNALEALARKLIFLEALALAPAEPKPPPLPLHVRQMQKIQFQMQRTPAPIARVKTYAFRLWPHAKPHPARISLLGAPTSRFEAEELERRRLQIERLKQGRANRLPEPQRLIRRLHALGHVFEKPLIYAKRLARKLAKASKSFIAKVALKRQPRSVYVDGRLQGDAGKLCWLGARALFAARADSS